MGGIWLYDLPEALAGLGGVSFYDGWETRSRSSGGYDALLGIAVHHTASQTSAANDTAYMWRNADDRPIGAIYLARDGQIIVGCAGATNCVGKGGPLLTTKGTIPKDGGNARSISIEAANNGVGEQWPDVQQDRYIELVDRLLRWYGFAAADVFSHHEWAPDRKIDPAGPSRFGTINTSMTWNMGYFRAALGAPDPNPIPPPIPEDFDMDSFLIRDRDSGGIALVYGDGKTNGIDGNNLDAWVARFGPWLDMDPNIYANFIAKGS